MRCQLAVRMAWGTALLLAPRAPVGLVTDGQPDPATRVAARMLGGREVAQALALTRHRSRAWILASCAVDTTHAISMLLLGALRPDYRRLAITSALIAGSFALAGLRSASGAS